MKYLQVYSPIADIVERAVKTFVQVFLAGITADAITGLDWGTLETAGMAGLAAAVSVLMNAILAWAKPETGGSAL